MPSSLSVKGAPMDTDKLYYILCTISLSPQYLRDSAKLDKSDAMRCPKSSSEVVTLSPSNRMPANIHGAKSFKSKKTSMDVCFTMFC